MSAKMHLVTLGAEERAALERVARSNKRSIRERQRAYVDGNDPVTGRPVMQEVIEVLRAELLPSRNGLVPPEENHV